MTSSLDLDIVVLDVNDNPPEFEQTTYLASIPESAAIGQRVTRIQATSRDTGINAKISYYIQAGNDKNTFTIDPKTGTVHEIKCIKKIKKNLPASVWSEKYDKDK